MRGVFISVWPVWCRLCRLHVLTPTPTNWRTQRIGNRKPPQRAAQYGARRHRADFSNLKKVSEQIWLTYFWNVFYQRTETNAKQTVRFNSRQIICLEQFLLRLFYFSIVYLLTLFLIFYHILAFATFLSIITCFYHIYANLENFAHLKMTSERSKRRDF